MNHRCTTSAKKAFCPPFKATIAQVKSKLVEERNGFQRSTSVSAHLSGNDTRPPSDEAPCQDNAAVDLQLESKGRSCPTSGGFGPSIAASLQRSTASCVRMACQCARQSPAVGKAAHKTKTTTGQYSTCLGDNKERAALADDTLRWIVAAQKAVQYLADALTGGDVERVLTGLHVSAQSVFFSTDEGCFVPP
ncbi:hypothetical protein ABL78_5683 [Leptomonas seymouri]|uniref:Uncharacterized protein n=1 Tax=Leptomonas seymouri TaxID=5684 RepID=A0A0N0P4G4_LEPSE|nr:hypothetical protein ABL78_5683 [Leptomonas seymouri]|eukprot:KPI85266.1 hypothetical protein ABL78_5683 [Leptomonas seymouri]